MYTKKMFLEDVKNIQGSNMGKKEIVFWSVQYDLYVLGARGVEMHDTTLVLMSQYDGHHVPCTETIESVRSRLKT